MNKEAVVVFYIRLNKPFENSIAEEFKLGEFFDEKALKILPPEIINNVLDRAQKNWVANKITSGFYFKN